MGVIYIASPSDSASDISHYRTKGSKNGVRLWQNPDGSYTQAGQTSKPGGRYNQSVNHRIDTIKANRTEKLAKGTGEYAQRKQSQGFMRQGVNSIGDLTAAARDLRSGKMSIGDGVKIYGKTALQGLAVVGGAAALTGVAAAGYYNMQNALGVVNYDGMNGLQQLFYNTGDLANSGAQMAKQGLQGAADTVKSQFANIAQDPGSWAKAAGQYVAEGAKSAGSALKNDLSEGLNTVKSWGQDAASKIGSSDILGSAKNGLQNAGSAIKEGASKVAENVANSSLGTAAGRAAQAARSGLTTAGDYIDRGMEKLGNTNVGSAIGSAYSKGVAKANEIGALAKSGYYTDALKSDLGALGDSVKNSSVGTFAGQAANVAKNKMSDLGTAAARAGNAVFNEGAIGNAVGNAVDGIKNSSVGTFAGQAANLAKNKINDLGTAAARAGNAVFNEGAIGNAVGNVANKFANSSAGQTIGNAVNSAKSGLGNIGQTIKNATSSDYTYGIKNDLSEGLNTVKSWGQDTARNIGSTLSGAASGAVNSAKSGLGNIGQTIKNATSSDYTYGIKNDLSEGLNTVKSWGQDTARNIGSTLSGAASSAADTAKNLGTAAANGAKNAGSSIKSGLSSLFSKSGSGDGITNLANSTLNTGNLTGFANGLASQIANATGAGKTQIKSIASTILDKLSPQSGTGATGPDVGSVVNTAKNAAGSGKVSINDIVSNVKSGGNGLVGASFTTTPVDNPMNRLASTVGEKLPTIDSSASKVSDAVRSTPTVQAQSTPTVTSTPRASTYNERAQAAQRVTDGLIKSDAEIAQMSGAALDDYLERLLASFPDK